MSEIIEDLIFENAHPSIAPSGAYEEYFMLSCLVNLAI